VKKKNMILVIIILLLVSAALCGFFFVRAYVTAQEEISEYSDVQKEYTSVIPASTHTSGVNPGDDSNISEVPSEAAGLPYTAVDFDALLFENPDTVGWLAIPDTVISYPVVQTKDNAKYLNVSFLGKRSSTGTPFADMGNNMRDLDANTIIYGHNMGFGRQDMFGALLSYKDSNFYATHRYIQFDTVSQHSWWKVFAVIEYNYSSKEFPYQQTRFASAEEFAAWVEKAKALSIYSDDTVLTPNGRVLTLSTCDRSKYGKNGRLLVLAVQITDTRG